MKIDWDQIYKLYEDEWQTKASARWSKHVALAKTEAAHFARRADIPDNSALYEAFLIGYRNGASATLGDAQQYIEKRLMASKRLTRYVLEKYEILQMREEELKTKKRNVRYELDQIKQLRAQLAKEDFVVKRCKKALLKNFTLKQVP